MPWEKSRFWLWPSFPTNTTLNGHCAKLWDCYNRRKTDAHDSARQSYLCATTRRCPSPASRQCNPGFGVHGFSAFTFIPLAEMGCLLGIGFSYCAVHSFRRTDLSETVWVQVVPRLAVHCFSGVEVLGDGFCKFAVRSFCGTELSGKRFSHFGVYFK